MATQKVILSQEILFDILAHFWTYFLLLLVLLSSFSVIYFTHLNRETTINLEVLLGNRDNLDIEYRNLILEQNALAETSVIEAKAEKHLDMKRPDAQSEIYLRAQ